MPRRRRSVHARLGPANHLSRSPFARHLAAEPLEPRRLLSAAPVAESDTYSVAANTTLLIPVTSGVLANDVDPDGPAPRAAITAQPEHGTLTLAPDGSFQYVPDPGFAGTDAFTYVALDGVDAAGFYTIRQDTDQLLWINESTGAVSVVGNLDHDANDLAMDWRTANDKLYAVNQRWAGGTHELWRINPITAQVEATLPLTVGGAPLRSVGGLTFFNGALMISYQVNGSASYRNARLGIINLLTGAVTQTANFDGVQGVAWGFDELGVDTTGRLIGANMGNDNFYFYSLTLNPPAVVDLGILHLPPVASADLATNADGVWAMNFGARKLMQFNGTLAPQVQLLGTQDTGFQSFSYSGLAYAPGPTFNMATATINVTAGPPPAGLPTANPDQYSGVEDTPLIVGVAAGLLANDTDPDSTVPHVGLVTRPAHGALQLNSDGSFTYTPAANFFGTDTFTYAALDAETRGASLYTIDAVQDHLLRIEVPSNAVQDLGPLNYDFTTVDLDYFDGRLYAINQSAAGITLATIDPLTKTILSTLPLSSGNLKSIGGLSFVGSSAYVTYQVHGGPQPGNTFLGRLNLATGLVSQLADFHYLSGGYALNFESLDTDRQGRLLTIQSSEFIFGHSYLSFDPPAYLTTGYVEQSGGRIDDLAFSYSDLYGLDPVARTLRKFDPHLNSPPIMLDTIPLGASAANYQGLAFVPGWMPSVATVTLSIAPVNDPPVAESDDYWALQNETLTTSTSTGVLGNDFDPDNASLSAILETSPVHGSLNIAADGSFQYQPVEGFAGSDSFSYRAFDGSLYSNLSVVTLTVIIPYAPEINVQRSGVKIADGDATPGVTDGTDFGIATANSAPTYITRQFTIENVGIRTLNLGAVTLSPATSNWAITQQPAATVAPGGSTTFRIRFQPTGGGFLSASVLIPNDDPNENPYDFAVRGYGITPGARIERNNLLIADGSTSPTVEDGSDFTAAGANVSAERVTREFIVKNTGTTALILGSVSVTTGTPAAWLVTQQPAASLAPGASTTFRVRFQPTATGLVTGTVHLPTSDPVYGDYTFDVRGVGTDATYSAEIEIRKGAIVIVDGDSTPSSGDGTDFGSAVANNVNARVTRQFTIYNLGVAPLVLKDPLRVFIDTTTPADWKVTKLPDSVIQPGGSTTFNVRFQPTSAGLKTATIRILNTDGNESPYDFAIQGLGTSAFAAALAERMAHDHVRHEVSDVTGLKAGRQEPALHGLALHDAVWQDDLAWLALRAADELFPSRDRKK